MKKMWDIVDSLNWKAETKSFIYMWLLSLMAEIIGLSIWTVVRTWTFNTVDSMICFAGYPLLIAWFAGYLYISNREFHESSN